MAAVLGTTVTHSRVRRSRQGLFLIDPQQLPLHDSCPPLEPTEWPPGLSDTALCFLTSLEKRSWHLPMRSVLRANGRYLPLASQHGTPGAEGKSLHQRGIWEMFSVSDVEGMIFHMPKGSIKFIPSCFRPTFWDYGTDCSVPWFWLLCSLHMGDTCQSPRNTCADGVAQWDA